MSDYKEREAAPAAPRIGFGCIEESIFWLVVLKESPRNKHKYIFFSAANILEIFSRLVKVLVVLVPA